MRDYTGKAFITFLLYFFGYVPGLLLNLLLLTQATGDKDQYGEAPGLGCLVWLLVVCGIGPVVGVVVIVVGMHFLY